LVVLDKVTEEALAECSLALDDEDCWMEAEVDVVVVFCTLPDDEVVVTATLFFRI